MLWVASILLKTVYLLLPVASLALFGWGRGRWQRLVVGGWVSGMVLGAALLAVYSIGIGGRLTPGQAALTLYCGVGLLLFLKSIDTGLTLLLRRLLLRKTYGRWRIVALGVCRLVLFGGFALPWVMAALMVYRPHILIDDPLPASAVASEACKFPATDGTPIAGWYFPGDSHTRTTALLCHGLGGNVAGFSRMIERLHEEDIGVLAIELRAHGGSGGQFSSFGSAEKADVKGAVDWLKTTHRLAATRVIGVGASLGAAALLGAAAQDQRIDGVAVLSTYSTLSDEVVSVSKRQFLPPIGWLVREFGLPLASLHVGIDLRTVRPIDDIAKLWPRPVLVVHGTADEIIPFEQGRALYDAAPVGRDSLWVHDGTHNGILDDAGVIDRLIQFIQSAEPTPVV